MSQFRFTDQQWHEYQEMPDQGYSHRGFLENAVNTGLAETIRQAKADGFDEGVRASGLDLDYILQLLDNPRRKKEPK